MRHKHIPLGKILGIPVGLDYTWFLIFALLAWTLSTNYFPHAFKGWSSMHYWVVGIITSLMLFVSVLLHEIGHSVIAMQYKIKVKRITLFIFGGIAEIEGEPPKAIAEFWIAIAGPIVSFLLAGLFYILKDLSGNFQTAVAIFEYLAFINLALAVFNLIPGFPLDGGRVFRAIVWAFTNNLKRATVISVTVGRFIAFLFIFIGAINLLTGNVGNGLWIAFIGWFLESAASSQLQQQHLQDHLKGHSVIEAMSRDFAIIPHDTTILEVMNNHLLGIRRRSLIVKENDKFIGLLTPHKIKDIPTNKWDTTAVTEAMISGINTEKVEPDYPMWEALIKMDKDGVNQLPVIENGEIIGILSRDNILTFLRELHESGG